MSLGPEYFDALYRADGDPWRFASSAYERRKYRATLAALPGRRFAAGFEVGCSIGVLTRLLAARCDRLLAVDVAEAALAQARDRCAGLDHVGFRRMRVPAEWPEGGFDLIVLSEVLYYLDRGDIAATAARAQASLLAGGAVVLVHYVLPTDYPTGGDAAAAAFIAAFGRAPSFQQRDRSYRLDLLRG